MKRFTEYKQDILTLFFLTFICIAIAIYLHQIFHYDFFYYQFFNSMSFLENRIDKDFLPVLFRSYYNPYLDLINYFLINKFNNNPNIYYIISSLDCTIVLFLVYKISMEFLKKLNLNIKFPVYLSILYVAFTPLMFEIFTTAKNDLKIACLILFTFFILLKFLFVSNSKKRDFFILTAGILMGAALGFKLTAFVYVLTFLPCILFLGNKPIKTFFLFIIGCFISFLVTDGYWIYTLYVHFKNPFFPHFNNIFKSPFCEQIAVWNDDYFFIRAGNLFNQIFYPFLYSRERAYGLVFRCFDLRYAINFICLFVLIPKCLKNKYYTFLVLFSFFSYEINTFLFGTYRYITSTSLLFGLILYLTIITIVKKENLSCIIMCLIFISALKIQIISNRLIELTNVYKNSKKLIEYRDLKLEDNSNVIFVQNNISYIIFGQNSNIRIWGFTFPKVIWDKLDKSGDEYFGNMFLYCSFLEEKLSNIIQSDHKIYLIFNKTQYIEYKNDYEKSLEIYSNGKRKIENCQEIFFRPKIGIPVICEFNRIE